MTQDILMNIIIWTIQLLAVPLFSPLVVGVIRKIKARLQNRRGAGILQPYRDLVKLMGKDEVISADASWIFLSSPYIVFAITLIVGVAIPLLTTIPFPHMQGDFLTIVYLIALSSFFLALAGLDTGSAFGGLGSSREMTIAALTEIGLIFSLLTLVILSGTGNVFQITHTAFWTSLSAPIPVILAFCGFFIALLSEAARFPFDNPETHLELTMIHEAMILEYSGKRLLLVEWAAANKLLIFIALGANLFFPWGLASDTGLGSLFVAMVVFAIKVLIFSVSIAVIESSIAKLRFFRLPNLLFTSFIFSVIALGLIIL